MLYIASLLIMGAAFALVRSRSERPKAPIPAALSQPRILTITVTPKPLRPSAVIIPFPDRRKFARSGTTPQRA